MKRPEYEFFSIYKKIEYFFSLEKINFKLISPIPGKEINIDHHAIIKNKSNLNIYLKRGNNLIISDLKNTKIKAEEQTNIFVFNSFSGVIDGRSNISLQKESKTNGNITCSTITISKPLFGNKSYCEMDGKLTLIPTKSS